MQCTPIFVVTYGPAKLLIDFSIEKFIQVLIAQLIYVVIAFAIVITLYERGVKKLNVNGG